jgi:hypothetical protein
MFEIYFGLATLSQARQKIILTSRQCRGLERKRIRLRDKVARLPEIELDYFHQAKS